MARLVCNSLAERITKREATVYKRLAGLAESEAEARPAFNF